MSLDGTVSRDEIKTWKMATLSSLHDRLQGLGSRLQAENNSKSRDLMTNNLTLEFNRERPGSERRPKNCKLHLTSYQNDYYFEYFQ